MPRSYSGTIGITSGDSTHPSLTVAVKGEGVSGTIHTPPALKFGKVPVGAAKTLPLTIRNSGPGALHATVDAPVPPGAFSLPSGANSLTLTLAPGKSRTIKPQFKPSGKSDFMAILTITSDDSTHPSVAVLLTGAGR
jgi:hypothetical protein